MQLHPIMYVPDQYAEREFYRRFGFEDLYEGEEFPGFLAVRSGEAVIGLQASDPDRPAYQGGLRWQFEVATGAELDALIAVAADEGLDHLVETEVGGDRFVTRLLRVRSPSGVEVWFEGPNEAGT